MAKTIHHVTISNKIYLPYFKRFGPITSPERIDDILLKSFRNMGYNVTVVRSEIIDPELGLIPTDTVQQPSELIIENDSLKVNDKNDLPNEEDIDKELSDVDISELDENSNNTFDNEDENLNDVDFPSKEEINKMTVAKLQELLNQYIHLIDESDLPLENKTKKQLIAITNKIIGE